VAVQEDASIVSFIDAQAGFPVIVGGADGRPASPSAADFPQPGEDFVYISLGSHRVLSSTAPASPLVSGRGVLPSRVEFDSS